MNAVVPERPSQRTVARRMGTGADDGYPARAESHIATSARKPDGPELVAEHARRATVYVKCAICDRIIGPPERICDLAAYRDGTAHVSCCGMAGVESVRR